MGLIIEDGKGKGYAAGVNKDNRLLVSCNTQLIEEAATGLGNTFSILFSKTPTGAADCFFYLKNNSSVPAHIKRFHFYVPSTGETIQVKLNDTGTPVGGTDVTPVNRNTGSGLKASVTAQHGVDITGLSGGNVVAEFTVSAAGDSKTFELHTGIRLVSGTTLTLYAVAGGIAIKGMMGVSFIEEE